MVTRIKYKILNYAGIKGSSRTYETRDRKEIDTVHQFDPKEVGI